MGRGYLEGFLDAVGDHVDIAKLPGLSVRLQPRDFLKDKIRLYREHGIKVFAGGMMIEAALVCRGVSGFLDDARDLGLEIVEVSESESRMVPSTKHKLIAMAKERGFTVTAELGPHYADRPYDPGETVREARACLEAGAWKVILESDVIDLMKPWREADGAERLTRIVDEIGHELIIFELPEDVRAMAQWLILKYGPDVNLALNKGPAAQIPEGIMMLEHIRRGLILPETWFGRFLSLPEGGEENETR
jgi:phosphosulfolactate synthase